MKRTLTSSVAVGGLILGFGVAPAAAVHEGSAYDAELTELNGSGASGSASLVVSDDGETMSIDLEASGFNLDGPHAIHLHGIVEDGDVKSSFCPTMADDSDGDGVLTVLEGAPKYGAVQVSLTTEGDTSADSGLAIERFPAGTSVDYSRTGIPIPEELRADLGKLHFVVHGIDENGNGTLDLDQEERSSLTDDLPREGTAPALCGTMTVSATGAIQTGAGGTASNESLPLLPMAAATAAGLAAVAVTGRRLSAVEA